MLLPDLVDLIWLGGFNPKSPQVAHSLSVFNLLDLKLLAFFHAIKSNNLLLKCTSIIIIKYALYKCPSSKAESLFSFHLEIPLSFDNSWLL